MNPKKPVLLLLHGATDDPTEMLDIAEAFRRKYNVLLYAYNYHQPIEKVAADLVGEFQNLVATDKKLGTRWSPVQKINVITYSYSSAVFRETVLLADDPALFSNVRLIQLTPTAGGSYLAREMGSNALAQVISKVSEPAAVENPYGPIAADIWGIEGSRKFYESIKPARVHTILIEGDKNSAAKLRDYEVQARYENGIGRNVTIIPKTPGVSHENLPEQAIALIYLRKLL